MSAQFPTAQVFGTGIFFLVASLVVGVLYVILGGKHGWLALPILVYGGSCAFALFWLNWNVNRFQAFNNGNDLRDCVMTLFVYVIISLLAGVILAVWAFCTEHRVRCALSLAFVGCVALVGDSTLSAYELITLPRLATWHTVAFAITAGSGVMVLATLLLAVFNYRQKVRRQEQSQTQPRAITS